jgi:hypothetical protein
VVFVWIADDIGLSRKHSILITALLPTYLTVPLFSVSGPFTIRFNLRKCRWYNLPIPYPAFAAIVLVPSLVDDVNDCCTEQGFDTGSESYIALASVRKAIMIGLESLT